MFHRLKSIKLFSEKFCSHAVTSPSKTGIIFTGPIVCISADVCAEHDLDPVMENITLMQGGVLKVLEKDRKM